MNIIIIFIGLDKSGYLVNIFLISPRKHVVGTRALEILKSESVQPMTMTSSMSPFPKKKMYISPITKTNDNWQSNNSF